MPEQSLPLQKGQALLCTIETGDLRRCVASWLLDGKLRGLSSETLTNRKLICDKLLWFLGQKELPSCGLSELKALFGYIRSGHEQEGGRWGNEANTRQVRPATALMYYARIRTLFAYAVEEGLLEASPFASLKPPVVRENQILPFNATQINALLHAAAQSTCPKRNRAILFFLLDTGVRASELCGLKMKDIDLPGQRCTVLGKGNKTRTIYFGRNTARALIGYLKEDEHKPEESLFFAWDELPDSRTGLTRSGLTQLIRRLGRSAKLEAVRCSPHTFRHTFAIEFLRGGGNQFSLMQLMGHTQMKQTARYVALAQADMESQHRQFSPGDKVQSKGTK
jgi:integrase/recombinase XerC